MLPLASCINIHCCLAIRQAPTRQGVLHQQQTAIEHWPPYRLHWIGSAARQWERNNKDAKIRIGMGIQPAESSGPRSHVATRSLLQVVRTTKAVVAYRMLPFCHLTTRVTSTSI